jgi:predicted AlkP superfamily pyrophosphatase or phosphodiesterase
VLLGLETMNVCRSTGVAVSAAMAVALLPTWSPSRLVSPDGATASIGQTSRPALLVLVVVDQFRADYVDTYGHQWTDGLREIFQRGAVFTNAAVPYALTRTCTGHSSIATSTLPSSHGMVDNEWFDRAAGRFVGCTEDPNAGPLTLGPGRAGEQHSARHLRMPTLAEELRRQAVSPPQVVSLALKARSAISLAGGGGARTIAIWEEDNGTWATSTSYATVPASEVTSFLVAHPVQAARGATWERRLPIEAYVHDDRAPGEPVTSVFPHSLRPSFGAPFTPIWDASPFSDAYIGDLAVSLIDRLGLGRSTTTDLLLLGFAALDYVGHAYGPLSHEVQDVLARLDVVLGRLLSTLDERVGRDRFVLALTSDHGVANLPVNTGGRVSLAAIGRAIDAALASAFGRRPVVRAISGSSIYLAPGAIDTVRVNPALREAVERALRNVPGVARVFWKDQLTAADTTGDALVTAMRSSYVADRSGDLLFVPEPRWVISEAGTNHGTPYDYDTRVPLALIGSRIAPGRHGGASSILDVAPTLATLAGIRMARAQGRVLTEAIGRVP